MLNEWTDGLPDAQGERIWQKERDRQAKQRLRMIESELGAAVENEAVAQPGFYEAMRHFLVLREKLFPGLPSDPVWKMLVTLAQTPPDSDLTSITSIAYGAEVPLTTALRYIAAMELSGVIVRVADPHDARRVMIRLTPEGRRKLDQISESWTLRLALLVLVPLAVSVMLHLP